MAESLETAIDATCFEALRRAVGRLDSALAA